MRPFMNICGMCAAGILVLWIAIYLDDHTPTQTCVYTSNSMVCGTDVRNINQN
jgi:hypothetical protein